MKRTAFNAGSFYRGIQEAKIKMRVMCDEYRALTAGLAELQANLTKNSLQGILFGYSRAQWVVRVYAGNFQ